MAVEIVVLENDIVYQEIWTNVLSRKGGYQLELWSNLKEFREKLEKKNYPVAIVSLETMQVSEYDDLVGLVAHYPKTKFVLVTDQNVAQYLELVSKSNLVLVLNKPVKSSELLNIVEKLLDFRKESLFGIKNYLSDIKVLKKVKINRSGQMRRAISLILGFVEKWKLGFKMQFEMDLVWQEIITNALYHSHGFSEEKRNRVPIKLPEGKYVEITFGMNANNQFGLSVKDSQGTLTKEQIIKSMKNAFQEQQAISSSVMQGFIPDGLVADHGRGLDIIRKMTCEYYFVLEPHVCTEVIVIYDGFFETDETHGSIRIFEIPKGNP